MSEGKLRLVSVKPDPTYLATAQQQAEKYGMTLEDYSKAEFLIHLGKWDSPHYRAAVRATIESVRIEQGKNF